LKYELYSSYCYIITEQDLKKKFPAVIGVPSYDETWAPGQVVRTGFIWWSPCLLILFYRYQAIRYCAAKISKERMAKFASHIGDEMLKLSYLNVMCRNCQIHFVPKSVFVQ
jgi:hypothetical protein